MAGSSKAEVRPHLAPHGIFFRIQSFGEKKNFSKEFHGGPEGERKRSSHP
jgi:hypothetical protein